MKTYLLGIDVGSSSVKASLVDAATGNVVFSAHSPEEEMRIDAPKTDWAEQDPEAWWQHACISLQKCLQKAKVDAESVKAIGIAYQMHGLVVVDQNLKPLRPSIIWCDSRAVAIGEQAFKTLGETYCLSKLLNSPGNFTASKLRWIKENEPELYSKIHKIMLPGDYLAMKLTGELTTTATGLSEGIFWNHENNRVDSKILDLYGIEDNLLADVVPVFSIQGRVNAWAAEITGLKVGTPIAYRSGDQPNNAFSLNVLNPGETAATAGTSGVIYSVTEENSYDQKSRVNTFIHVNDQSPQQKRNGVLLCINGTGSLNSWVRRTLHSGQAYSYETMNQQASQIAIGSDGLKILPFGNGAERMLENKGIGSSVHGLDFNRHTQAHIFRASQEGIAFAFRYGFDILKAMHLPLKVIRAGHANMFLSPLFREAFVNLTQVPLELYDTDGAKGAALGAGVGSGIYQGFEEAFKGLQLIKLEEPEKEKSAQYQENYQQWLAHLKSYNL